MHRLSKTFDKVPYVLLLHWAASSLWCISVEYPPDKKFKRQELMEARYLVAHLDMAKKGGFDLYSDLELNSLLS
jgi:hypothetical protein